MLFYNLCTNFRYWVSYFQKTVKNGSESMSSSILDGSKPVLQQISSILCRPVYNFCRPIGVSVHIGNLLMQRIKLCCKPNATSFLQKKKNCVICWKKFTLINSKILCIPFINVMISGTRTIA